MKQRGAGEPGHQRGIFHRVPKPEPAPAELVIGPPAPERDAKRERAPGHQHPRPHDARERFIDTPADERGRRKGKHDRKADIAEIKDRRMEGETGVLENGIEVVALDRRRIKPDERVCREQHEAQERRTDHALNGERARLERRREAAPQGRDEKAEAREDQRPQQHRAFVVPPQPGDLVEHRLGGVGVLRHVEEREIRNDMGVHQNAEGERHEQALDLRRARAEQHQPCVALCRPHKRHRALHQRDDEREGEREMSDLRGHQQVLMASPRRRAIHRAP